MLELELSRCRERRRTRLPIAVHTAVWKVRFMRTLTILMERSPNTDSVFAGMSCRGECFGWSGITAQSADCSSCPRPGGKLSQRHQPTFTPVIFAYVCVHGAICGAACTCEYTSVSLQVECVHVCALVRLLAGLFVSGSCGTHRRSARFLSPLTARRHWTRYLKYLTA